MKHKLFAGIACISFVFTLMITGCEKKYIIDVTRTCTECAQVKFLNGNPDPDASYQFYVNDAKITGDPIGYAGLFPGTVEYAAIPAGDDKVTVKIAVNDSTFNPVASQNVSLESGKRYGLIWTGSRDKSPLIVVNNRDMPTDSGYIMAQFVNLIKSDQTVDVINETTGEAIFSAVPYKGVKDYVKVPVNDEYTIRETGTHIVLAKDQEVGSSETRNYTWYARGIKYDTIAGSPTRITLDYYTNGYPKTL